MSTRVEVARVEFPPEWLLGRSWLFTEVLFTKELDDGLALLAGGVLDDGTNLHALVFPGGQRVARHAPPDWSLETRLSDALAAVLSNDLNPRDRIDFLASRVGIEVKVNGSSAAVERQVRRYTESHRIDAVILLTSCSRHASIARSFNGKPVHVVPTFRA